MEKRVIVKRALNKLNDIQFIILMVIISYGSAVAIVPLANLYEKYIGRVGEPTHIYEMGKLVTIIFTVVLGPITESLIIIFIIRVLSKLKISKRYVWIGTSIIFSSLHTYSVFYMFAVFIPAIIFVYSYMYYNCKKITSFTIMTIIHSLHNLAMFIGVTFFL